MSENPRQTDGSSIRVQTTGSVRQRINEQLAHTKQVLGELTRELSRCRDENRLLRRQRDRLQRRVTTLEALEVGRAAADAQLQASQRQLEALAADNQQLRSRCAQLEHALAEEAARNDTLQLDTACLEEQIRELTSIVHLLSDDDSLLVGIDD